MKKLFDRRVSYPCVLAFVIACATAQAASDTAATKDVGLVNSMAHRIDELTANYVAEEQLAGTVILVARRGEIAYFEAVGQQDIERVLPMERDSLFRLHSMTKPIATVAAMILMEEGAIDPTDPVSKFIPEFAELDVYVSGKGDDIVTEPQKRAMTIHHLLTHQSGLTYSFMGPHPVHEIYEQVGWGDLGLSKPNYILAERVSLLGDVPLVLHPGTSWRYSISSDVLARVVEIASGMAFRDFVLSRILGPLGMNDTDFFAPEEKLGRLTAVYGPADGGRLKLLDDPLSSDYAKKPIWVGGGSGLVGSAMDYYKFAQMMLNKGTLDGVRLLSSETVELMTQDQLEENRGMLAASPGRTFGYGGHVVLEEIGDEIPGSLSEYGWGGSSMTDFAINPQEQLAIVIMVQFRPFSAYPIGDEIKRIVYESIVD